MILIYLFFIHFLFLITIILKIRIIKNYIVKRRNKLIITYVEWKYYLFTYQLKYIDYVKYIGLSVCDIDNYK